MATHTQKIKGKLIEDMFAWIHSQNQPLRYAQYSVIYRSDKHNYLCIRLGKYFCSMEEFCHASTWLQGTKELQVKMINKKTKNEQFQMLFISN